MLSGIGFRSERVTVHVQCLWRTVFLVFPHLQHINGDKYVVDVVLARHEIQCRPSLSMYAKWKMCVIRRVATISMFQFGNIVFYRHIVDGSGLVL